MKHIIYTIVLIFFSAPLFSQDSALDKYIKLGLESNLVLKQKELSHQEAIVKLKEARGLFLPEVSLNARYSISRGGRTIDIPVGDMMNPAYESLNDLTGSDFPMLQNVSNLLQPEKEQETKLELIQPVFNRSIYLNKQIQKENLGMSEADLNRYRETLVYQIKEAYYNILKTENVVQLMQSTKELVRENLRVSQKLLDNDMVTKEYVLRSKTEVNKVALSETEALKGHKLAIAYLNFLLNRPLEEPINTDIKAAAIQSFNQLHLADQAVNKRAELKIMDHQIESLDLLAKVNSAANMPSLTFVANYGFLGEEYNFGSDDDVFTGTLSLNWTLFKGRVNKRKRQQTLIRKQQAELSKANLSNSIRFEVKESLLEVNRQKRNIELSETQSSESQEVYRIIDKKYRIGESTLLELMDARTNMTDSEFNLIISRFDYWVSIANLEYTTASSTFL
ncbi:hypothetical protein GCQ56_18310 [Marinifilum sp. N1E240]|uniref:TolC family protein n=1 Tax=Marinifilum sp. N1E240 TaxID=2608082 RepID=UPI00128E8972|nr:TolC family protein [Marinifilum sp. N1E240]MPQ48955.1 hypothetical protein [Marinifilum sp. N1E240]